MNIVYIGTSFDKPYTYGLKVATKGMHNVIARLDKLDTLFEVEAICKRNGSASVICSRVDILKKLVTSGATDKEITLGNFAGNLIHHKASGIKYLIINPLKQTRTMPQGQFMLNRYVTKLTKPDNWMPEPEFNWRVLTPSNAEEAYRALKSSFLIGVDIETSKALEIRCIGFCGIALNSSGEYTAFSVVVPMNSEYMLTWARKFSALEIPKVTQNGKYDINYMLRYNIVMSHWLWDTANLLHCWYSELPKDLGFVASFCLLSARYWKSDTHLMGAEELHEYNAKDIHYTALAAMAMINEMPKWARDNYLMEFPMNYPCLVCELTGMKADEAKLEEILDDTRAKEEKATAKLRHLISAPNFNPGSPKQTKQLLKILGCGDLKSTDEAHLNIAAFRHPLNELLLNLVLEVRGLRKLISTYLVPEKLFKGRVLYALNPHGTDTGRLASKAHHFWCGLQIQNIPRTGGVKDFMVADEGYLIGEADYSQAESRGTAYVTGDSNLLAAVNSPKDFHSVNASAFFGVAYEDIINEFGKVINKALRDLAKRVNHGANYNMGESVLVMTMGLKKIYEAKRLLGLQGIMSPSAIAKVLLTSFANTYKKVRFNYQVWIKSTIAATNKLVGATGWTRYCFGDPSKSKPALNAYIAHVPQNLNAMILNKAFMGVYRTVWKPDYHRFKMSAQIHDSILYQYKEGHEELNERVVDCMLMDIQVKDIDGVVRTMRVPVDVDCGGKSWKDSKED